ncbi:MAG: hypothetical protein C0622_00295 [Desulfuromonas sp.]|nr:MAG: hypothetical protein C0622_00295 [Desulfuromonas sp.]
MFSLPRYFITFILFVLSVTNTGACDLPTDNGAGVRLFPPLVRERFCQPEEGYASLLLIRAAVNEDRPVYRVIAVEDDDAESVRSVRLYQFDAAGNEHPEVGGEPQAVIDFAGTSPRFEARVKGRRTTISFAQSKFEFSIYGLFGLKISQALNERRDITVGGSTARVLLMTTSDRDHWRWVLENGEQVAF